MAASQLANSGSWQAPESEGRLIVSTSLREAFALTPSAEGVVGATVVAEMGDDIGAGDEVEAAAVGM